MSMDSPRIHTNYTNKNKPNSLELVPTVCRQKDPYFKDEDDSYRKIGTAVGVAALASAV